MIYHREILEKYTRRSCYLHWRQQRRSDWANGHTRSQLPNKSKHSSQRDRGKVAAGASSHGRNVPPRFPFLPSLTSPIHHPSSLFTLHSSRFNLAGSAPRLCILLLFFLLVVYVVSIDYPLLSIISAVSYLRTTISTPEASLI